MPSLWKKCKGNRISRLVADIQTTPKRGGSLVVETGFPTSLVDLFVKNCDKLKKSKSRKPKSKSKKTPITEDDDDVDEQQQQQKKKQNLASVSCKIESFSKFEVPRCSNVRNCQQNVAKIDLFVEEIVAHENPVVEMYHDDSCKNEGSGEKIGVVRSNNMVLLSILMVVVVFIVVLCAKRWFLALFTLVFLLLLLLEYEGNSVLRLFKPCEKVVWMLVLKGALVVGVALYTKWFVAGITFGALLLLLLEYAAGNSGFRLFEPCHYAKWKLQGILLHRDSFQQRRGFGERIGSKGRGVLTRSFLIGSKRNLCIEGEDDVSSSIDFEQEGAEIEDLSRRKFELDSKSGVSSNREDEKASSKGKIEQGIGESIEDLSRREFEPESKGGVFSNRENEKASSKGKIKQGIEESIEEETEKKPIYEILDLELNYSKYTRSSKLRGYVDLLGGKRAIGGREIACEESEIINQKDKNKKSKKFWKKFVPKKMHKKKKLEREGEHYATYTDGIQDTGSDLEEEDEQEECEQEITDGEGSTTLSLVDEDECGIDNFEAARTCLIEMLQLVNKTNKPCEMVKEKEWNYKYLTTMMIPLTGLIGGRMFAVVLTIICCLVFKMVRG